MSEIIIVSLTTFFAVIGPIDVAVVFAALTTKNTQREKRAMAARGVVIGTIILLLFAFAGNPLLSYMGISLAALRVGGGILLLLVAIDMVFARSSGSTSTTDEEEEEAQARDDISVFPLATPLIAGPGAIGAVILLMADTAGDPLQIALVLGPLLVLLFGTWLLLLIATRVDRLLGVTGLQVVSRVFGILLAALSVQFIFDGLAQSGLF
ncbi:MAG: MarC family protein [Chloroflexota bacterium]